MKKYVRVDIVDSDYSYDERLLDSYILVSPNKEKLEELQELLNNRFDDENSVFNNEFGSIYDFINENFEILYIVELVEIEW